MKIIFSFKPSENLIEKTIIFENIPAGEKNFSNKISQIDIKYLEENKIHDKFFYDLIIELEVLKETGITECYLISCSKIHCENKKLYKIKSEKQKLILRNIWFDLHDIYGFNTDINSYR